MTTYFLPRPRAIVDTTTHPKLNFGQTGEVVFEPDSSSTVTFIPDGNDEDEYTIQFNELYFPQV
jgi:hypothetical protein